MQLVGHRGAAGLATENTRVSFQAALKAGVDWIEFDVRATSDGHVVVFHDSHTLRTTNKAYIISRTPLATLQRVRLNGNQSIPTLTEALNNIGGHAKVMIELKTAGCARIVVQNIERLIKKGMRYSDFCVGSFTSLLLREVRVLNEHIPLFLFHLPNKSYRFLHVRGLDLQGVGFHHRFLPARAIEQAHMHGLEVYIFTVNSKRRARKFVKLGADMIGTNRPDLMQDLRG